MFHAFFLAILRRVGFRISVIGAKAWLVLTLLTIVTLMVSLIVNRVIQRSRILSLVLIGKCKYEGI